MSKGLQSFPPKKVSFFSFLLLSVLFIGLLVATGLIGKPTRLNTQASIQVVLIDWAPKGAPHESWDTASEVKALLGQFGTQGTYPHVYKYLGGCPLIYPHSVDFSIEPGRGYLFRANFNPKGGWKKLFENYEPVYSMSYDLTVGNARTNCGTGNRISFPEGVLSQLRRFSAEDLCTEINAQGGSVFRIHGFKQETMRGAISENVYHCGSGSGDFVLKSGSNYRVFVSAPSTFSL